jgi:hypothetical protein
LNNDNPFISKPNQAEIYSFKGKITLQEWVGALNNMKYFKSPGIEVLQLNFINSSGMT